MKNKIYLILLFVLVCNDLISQSTDLYKLDYVRESEKITSIAFKINNCSKETILNVWEVMVEGNGGKLSTVNKVLGIYKSDFVEFKEMSIFGPMTIRLELISQGSDSLVVSNAFQMVDLTYVDLYSDAEVSKQSVKILQQFSDDVKKECKVEDLTNAIDYAEQLHNDIYKLQSSQMSLENQIAKLHKRLPKLRLEEKNYFDQISFYDRKIQQISDPLTKLKLQERLESVKKNYEKSSQRLKQGELDLENAFKQKTVNDNEIERLKQELKIHQTVIDQVKDELDKL